MLTAEVGNKGQKSGTVFRQYCGDTILFSVRVVRLDRLSIPVIVSNQFNSEVLHG